MKKSCSIVLIIALGLITYLSSCSKPDLGQDFGDTGCFGCGPQDTTSITIHYSKFTPDTLIVKKGTTVTWWNWDNYTHNLISTNDAGFSGGNIAANGELKYITKKIGTLKYHCTIHSESATLIITP